MSHFSGSSLQAEKTRGWNPSDHDDTFCQLLIRSAILGFQGGICSLPGIIARAMRIAMLTAPHIPFHTDVWLGLWANKRKRGPFLKGKCLLLFRLCCKCSLILYFLCYFHSFYGGRNDFRSNFSAGVLRSTIYLQPHTSVLHSDLIQLGDTRWWLTPPQAQSTGGPEQYGSVFSSITGRQILLKVFTRRRCVSSFPKVGAQLGKW